MTPRAPGLMCRFYGGHPRARRPRAGPTPAPSRAFPCAKSTYLSQTARHRTPPESVFPSAYIISAFTKGTLCSMNAHWHLPIATACHCTSRSFAGVLLTCPMKGMLRGGSPQQRVWHSPHHIQIGQQLLPMCQSTIAFTGHLASCCGACMWNSTGATEHPRRMSNMASSRPLVALQ